MALKLELLLCQRRWAASYSGTMNLATT